MSIQSEINRIKANVVGAYLVLSAKGATMPSTQNTANLASAIESIPINAEAMSIETIWAICGYDPNGGLPDGYTLLEYIQSSGTQYINTGFVPNNNTCVVMDFQFETTPSSHSFLFGVRTSSSSGVYGFLWLSSGYFRSDYNNSETGTLSVAATGRKTVTKNKETTTLAGVSQSHTNSTFSCAYNLYLFARNNKGTADCKATVRVYSCQIYDNGALVRDFVPCINDSGVYGLYDKVNSTFYANAGSGSFTGV